MDGQLQVALLGAGLIAEGAHLPSWARTDGAAISVVVDRDPERAQAVAEAWGVPEWHTDFRDVLEEGRIDAVDICLPPRLHADFTEDALAAGVHVLLEKPFVSDLAEARRMLGAESASDATLLIAENWPYASAYAQVRDLLDNGRLGELFMLRGHHESRLFLDEAAATVPPWQLDVNAAAGGYLMNAGIHMVNLARELMGEFRSLHCYTTAHTGDDLVLDYDAVLAGACMNGGLVSMNFTGRSKHLGERRLAFGLFGTRGTAEFDILTGDVTWTIDGTRMSVSSAEASMGYDEEIAHFVACVRGEARPRTSARDQTIALATVLAAYESMRRGEPVVPGAVLAAAGLDQS